MEKLQRGTYIGGHEASAIVGAHPYMTAHDVYAACALGWRKDISDQPAVRRGSIVEPGLLDFVVRVIEREREDAMQPPPVWARGLFVQDADVPFFAGTTDLTELDAHGNVVHIHEVTTTTSRSLAMWGEDGTSNAATYKWMQTQWYMGITGATAGTVWCMVLDTGEIRRYPIERNDVSIANLRAAAEAFWLDHVIVGAEPPMPDTADVESLARMNDTLNAMWRGKEKKEIASNEQLVAFCNDYAQARAEEEAACERKGAAAALIKSVLGDATFSKWKGGHITWSRNKGSESVDDALLLRNVVQRFKLDEKEVAAMRAAVTRVSEGARVLRVTIKEEKA